MLPAIGAEGVGFTVNTIAFDVIGFMELQVALDVTVQVMLLLFGSILEVKVLKLVPTLIPLFFHCEGYREKYSETKILDRRRETILFQKSSVGWKYSLW